MMSKHFTSVLMFAVAGLLLTACNSQNVADTGSQADSEPMVTQTSRLQTASRDYQYHCENGEKIIVSYVTTGGQFDAKPMLMVLRYQGKHYGFALAVSASGARYIAPAGLTTASSLEWIEKGGEGLLSKINFSNSSDTQLIERCNLQQD